MPLPDLTHRRLQPELMDDPALEARRHERALRALERVNVLSGTTGRVWAQVRALAERTDRPLRILDLACGGGDVALALMRRSQRAGAAVEIHACDRSPVALDHARRRAGGEGLSVRFFEMDVLREPLPEGYDLVFSSLFLHHLTREDAVGLLRAMANGAPAVFIQDLRRTRVGFALAALTLNTVARSDVARVDGLRSVAGAFTLGEVRELAAEAGLEGYDLRRCWPQRFALSWRRA